MCGATRGTIRTGLFLRHDEAVRAPELPDKFVDARPYVCGENLDALVLPEFKHAAHRIYLREGVVPGGVHYLLEQQVLVECEINGPCGDVPDANFEGVLACCHDHGYESSQADLT